MTNFAVELDGLMVPSDLNPAAEAAGAKEKALKNDEVHRCVTSVHSRDLSNHHSEYHPIDCNSAVQVEPLIKNQAVTN